WSEIALRLGVATLAGSAVGLNRDLHGKPIGLRTLSLVALATSMVVALTDPGGEVSHFSDASSRVVQGVLTGIGFLGAGVILHGESKSRVRGLTSAALTWLTACIGIMCGAGQWRIVAVAVAITFVILMIGGGVEKRLHRALGGRDFAHDGDKSQPSDAGPHQPGK
ncbi:MAG: magnesium transporter, partial [Tardiphaga sp.]|nr:magnesium transporter [Tardiphaga sp.]